MRWLVSTVAAAAVLLATFPMLASGSSDGPGKCQSALELRTLGDSNNCDTLGAVVSLAAAVIAFLLIAWGWKYVRGGRR